MSSNRSWRVMSGLLYAVTFAAAAAAQSAPVALDCPAESIDLNSGDFLINTPCVLAGDLRLSGTATLTIEQTQFVLDGSVSLRDQAKLVVRGAAFTLDNHFVLEHRIESFDSAQLHFIGAVMSTNVSSPGNSFASQYLGHGNSVLIIVHSQILLPDSWLLADLQGHAAVHTVQSTNFPSEIYPHGNATVIIEGDTADHRVWLEFVPGSIALLDELPPPSAPFSFSFGRETPGVDNVGYQVEVIDAIATFGVASHRDSQLTVRDTESPISIGYFLTDVDTPELVSGVGPIANTITLTHQNRLFELDNASLEGFAWQVYVANPGIGDPAPVNIENAMLNEIAALDKGRLNVAGSLLQWAVIAAIGPGSEIQIAGSTINSQSIIAAADGVILIDSSNIYGSIVQATDDAFILLSNNRFEPNVCHALCLPVCPSLENGGFEGDRCNAFNPPGADPTFEAKDRAAVAAVGLDPIAAPVTSGDLLPLSGDLFVELGPDSSRSSYSYLLRYVELGTGAGGIIVAEGAGPKRGEELGALDTTDLPEGDYIAILELHIDGVAYGAATQMFTVATP